MRLSRQYPAEGTVILDWLICSGGVNCDQSLQTRSMQSVSGMTVRTFYDLMKRSPDFIKDSSNPDLSMLAIELVTMNIA